VCSLLPLATLVFAFVFCGGEGEEEVGEKGEWAGEEASPRFRFLLLLLLLLESSSFVSVIVVVTVRPREEVRLLSSVLVGLAAAEALLVDRELRVLRMATASLSSLESSLSSSSS
jgi:hypothetical protein